MGRGRGGGGHGGGLMSRDVQVSKKLSWLLRHGAVQEKLNVGKGGYVNLSEVLNNRNIRSLKTNLEEIQDIVATNAKQRFSLIHTSTYDSHPKDLETSDSATSAPGPRINELVSSSNVENDKDPSHYYIRANQGHSIKLADTETLLTPITIGAGNLPSVVVHGTRHEHWAKIKTSGGLKPMGRNHVHFATGVPEPLQSSTLTETTEVSEGAELDNSVSTLADDAARDTPAVLSGMRNSSTILIFINLRLALENGLHFWLSENGVVLSEGDDNGLIGIKVFEKVEERGGRILVRDGVAVADANMSLATGSGAGGRRGGRGGGRARGKGRSREHEEQIV